MTVRSQQKTSCCILLCFCIGPHLVLSVLLSGNPLVVLGLGPPRTHTYKRTKPCHHAPNLDHQGFPTPDHTGSTGERGENPSVPRRCVLGPARWPQPLTPHTLASHPWSARGGHGPRLCVAGRHRCRERERSVWREKRRGVQQRNQAFVKNVNRKSS